MKYLKKNISGFFIMLLVVLLLLILKSHSHADNTIAESLNDSITSYNSSKYDRLLKTYDSLFSLALHAEKIPGAAIGIIKKDSVFFQKCYGVKEFEGKDSIDKNTVFRIGSVSKGFASVLASMLVKEGLIDWDDTVKSIVTDFDIKNDNFENTITIKNILSHTTGLPKHTYTNLLDRNVPLDNIMPLLSEVESFAAPGEYYSYQNVIYSIIAQITEVSTGKSYQDLVKEKIFSRFSMDNASIDYNSILNNNNVAKPHLKINSRIYKTIKLNQRYYSVAPASGINASISDMMCWLKAIMGMFPEIIDSTQLKDIYEPQIRTYIRWKFNQSWKQLGKIYYGMGWRIVEYHGKKLVYHGGYVRGYRAEIAFLPEEHIGMVVLFNCSCCLANKCIPEFFERYFNYKEHV